MQLVDTPHDHQISHPNRSGQVIDAAPADPQPPHLARSVFTSVGGSPVSNALSELNTPAATSSNWLRHVLICFGCTSNCCVNSASVFSPFTAANATLALKTGLWFRRDRLLFSAPVSQPSSLPSGRKSTYLTVPVSPGHLSSQRIDSFPLAEEALIFRTGAAAAASA